jgi:hypothetical protein
MQTNITKKQQEEINFLSSVYKVPNPTDQEIKEYLDNTVLGIGKFSSGGMEGSVSNRLFEAKRKLDIDIKSWREDLTKGLLGADELKEDFNCEYGNKLVDSILNGVTREYRQKILSKGEATILAFTNFPKIMNKFTEK